MLQILLYGGSIPVIKGFFSLTLVFNRGAVFGIMQEHQILFLILPVLTVVVILILYFKSKEKQGLILPAGLLVGGTIGNFVDRLRHGYVIDFFDLFYRTWHWPAFNIADACICFGVLLILLAAAVKKR